MKLIIDISKGIYERIKWVCENGMGDDLQKKVIKGIPLNKIRAEISETFIKHGLGNTEICFDTLQIIDRYREDGDPCE